MLSLDDDILVPCATVEAAFAEWRRAPQRLLGFYPRLLRPAEPGGPPVYQFEEYVFQQVSEGAQLSEGQAMSTVLFLYLLFELESRSCGLGKGGQQVGSRWAAA